MATVHSRSHFKYIIGIDEVGRGPLAGPVAVGGFVLLKPEVKRIFKGVKESKQLTEQQRETWFALIKKCQNESLVDFAVTFQSEKVIDVKGLSYAIRTALNVSLQKVVGRLPGQRLKRSNQKGTSSDVKCGRIQMKDVLVLLDGGLKAPAEYPNQQTIIKGDEKQMVIALASICAKVLRDRRMIAFSRKYPEYGFEKHKGYGSREHYEVLKKCGALPIHRKSFLH
jgi:ribonuclease HII